MSEPNTTVTVLAGRTYWPGDKLPRWNVELACGHKVATIPGPTPPKVGQRWHCRRCADATRGE
jgi:hypothetical protein